MPDLPVAAPDHAADTMPLLTIHGAALHAMAEGKPEEAAHITAILARRLREQAALLAERQQDKERIERLEAALNEARPYVEWMAAGPRDAADDASTAKAVLAQVDAALTVEEDAHG